MIFRKKVFSFLSSFLLIFLVGCNNDDNASAQGTAQLAITLTDAPGDYDAVNIDVQDVVIKYNDSDEEVAIGEVEAGVYDLLELTGGVTAVLVDDEVPAGTISQIRLVLGENNTIVVDGETFDMATPSAQQSGLKLQVNQTLEDGVLYEFILDFMVDESIVVQGNGNYSLKPVIRANTVAESGAISASIVPVGTVVEVTAVSGITSISSFANADGSVLLRGVPEGTYTVTFQPDLDLGLDPVVVEDVTVTTGEVVALGEVLIE